MKLTLKIESGAFTGMVRELSRLSGKEFAHVLRLEAASSIKIAATRKNVASASAIKRDVEKNDTARVVRTTSGEILVGRQTKRAVMAAKGLSHAEILSHNVRKAQGRVWYIDATGKAERKFMVFDAGPTVGWHLPDAVFARAQALAAEFPGALKARLRDLLARRGLERLSWVQITDAMRIDMDDVAPVTLRIQDDLVRAANYRGKQFSNGRAAEAADSSRFTVTVTNESPSAIKTMGQSRLNNAIAQRVKGFEIAMSKGLFDDLKARARRYPGIFVSQS